MTDCIELLLGRHLSSVEFVQDYVQVRFDGVCLTINAPFLVSAEGSVYRKHSPGFADSLRNRIGESVRKAYTIIDREIVIELTDSSTIEVSLAEADQVSPEAAVLVDEEGQTVVW